MSATSTNPDDSLPPVGYTDDWTVRPGQVVDLHVSCQDSPFTAGLVHLSYDPGPNDSLDLVEEPIPSNLDGHTLKGPYAMNAGVAGSY